ncbi:MAG TPA: biotin attachment protein, partial [Firmicutes bacterium]|nr:biotin attachment protein [Bacillota bacterium]
NSGEVISITTALPGLILRVNKKVGDTVKKEEAVIVLESMKMETPLIAPAAGKVVSILVAPGQQIQTGTVVATIAK